MGDTDITVPGVYVRPTPVTAKCTLSGCTPLLTNSSILSYTSSSIGLGRFSLIHKRMEVVREYMTLYPEDKIVVFGGYAAYLYIRKYLGIEFPVKDIDVQVYTDTSHRFTMRKASMRREYIKEVNQGIFDRFKRLLPWYTTNLKEIDVMEFSNPPLLHIDVVINRFGDMGVDFIDGIPVLPLQDLIGEDRATVDFLEDLMNNLEEEEDPDFIQDKMERVSYRLSLMESIDTWELSPYGCLLPRDEEL